jgi:hypothetical protein
MFRLAFYALSVTVMILGAGAGIRAQMPDFQPVALTEAGTAQAISAMPGVMDVARRHEASAAPAGGDPLGGLAGLATYAAARAELDAAVGGYGFSGYEGWVETIQTVMHTFAYVRSAGAMQQMAPAMDAAIQQIIANPGIPQAQKDAIIARMGGSQAAMAGMVANAPSPGNQAIVNALMPEIEAMIAQLRSAGP